MKTFLLAATAVITAVIAMAAPSEAGSRWHDDRYSYGHSYKRIVIDYNPHYYDDDCYTKKIRKYNSWGKLVFKKITICE